MAAILCGRSLPCRLRPRSHLETHEVFNQPAPRETLPLWEEDAPLRAAVGRAAAGHAGADRGLRGRHRQRRGAGGRAARQPLSAGTRHLRSQPGGGSTRCGSIPPITRMMARGFGGGYSALPGPPTRPGGHAAHAAMVYLLTQVEPGVCCPMTMTYAAIPALDADAGNRGATGGPSCCRRDYDGRSVPATQKAGLTHRHGDDGKAGRLGPARQHHARRAAMAAGYRLDRPQMVLLGADVRCLPDAGAIAGGSDLLPGAALDAGWRAQRHPPDAAQGQARQPRQRLGRDRVSRRLGRAAGRAGHAASRPSSKWCTTRGSIPRWRRPG